MAERKRKRDVLPNLENELYEIEHKHLFVPETSKSLEELRKIQQQHYESSKRAVVDVWEKLQKEKTYTWRDKEIIGQLLSHALKRHPSIRKARRDEIKMFVDHAKKVFRPTPGLHNIAKDLNDGNQVLLGRIAQSCSPNQVQEIRDAAQKILEYQNEIDNQLTNFEQSLLSFHTQLNEYVEQLQVNPDQILEKIRSESNIPPYYQGEKSDESTA